MAWVTWVTWVFVGIAVVVAAVAVGLSRGVVTDSFEDPYDDPATAEGDGDALVSGTEGARSGVRWSEPAAGTTADDLRDDTEPAEQARAAQGVADEPGQHHPKTTGEPADGRYEAQDR